MLGLELAYPTCCQAPKTLGMALARPKRDWAWQWAKPRARPRKCASSLEPHPFLGTSKEITIILGAHL